MGPVSGLADGAGGFRGYQRDIADGPGGEQCKPRYVPYVVNIIRHILLDGPG